MIPKIHSEVTYEWLRSRGFRIEYPNIDNTPHMVIDSSEARWDTKLELAPLNDGTGWHCWLRDDSSHRRGKFIHVRYIRTKQQIEKLFEGVSGRQLPIEEINTERFTSRLNEISAECDKHWRDYCDKQLREHVVFRE